MTLQPIRKRRTVNPGPIEKKKECAGFWPLQKVIERNKLYWDGSYQDLFLQVMAQ